MKIILRTVAVAALIVTTSCGKETANVIADLFDKEVEELERTVLDIEKVTDNVLINGATKMEGTPPTPNGAISLDIANTGKVAFLDEGFEVSLNSDSEITGAYIQFKSKDGSISDSYYDVNLETNSSSDGEKSLRKRRVRKGELSAKVEEASLDVDFNSNVEPGEFCYVLCVYDASGNISAPQEVCVTVESWGGKSELVASWNLTKESETYNGNSSTQAIGEEQCSEESSYDCNQGGQYQASYVCYTTDSFVIEFKQDGTYKYTSMEIGRKINGESSSESCDAIYDEFVLDYISNGRWAFVSEGSRLILIEYSYSENYDGSIASDTFEPGEGDVLLDGTIEFNGDSIIISEDYSEGIDTYHFEK